MAEIPQYQAQPGDVAGPIETARQARPEDVNIGGGLERLGAGVSSAGDAIERRAKQEDLIAAHTSTSRIGSAMQAQAKDAINNYQQVKDPATGAVDFAADAKQRQDMEENFRQQLNDQLDKAGDAIQTEFGKKYFSIHRDNTFAQSMSSFHNGMAQLAAKNTGDAINEQTRLNTTTIASDPKQFGQITADHNMFITQTGKLAGLNPSKIQEQIDKDSKLNAFAAIDGWARTKSPDTAKAMLDAGTYDRFLSQADKEQLYTHVEQIQKANNYDQDRMDRQQEKAQKELQQKTFDGALATIHSGNVPKDFMQQVYATDPKTLLPRDKENLQKQLDSLTKDKKWTGDSKTFAALMNNADLPPGAPGRAKSVSEYRQYLDPDREDNITYTQYEHLVKHFEGGTPERTADTQLWKDQIKAVWAQQAQPDKMTGLPTTKDEGAAANRNRMALENLRLDYLKNNIPAADAWNPKSKNWVGNKVSVGAPGFMQRILDIPGAFGLGGSAQTAAPQTAAQQKAASAPLGTKRVGPDGVMRTKTARGWE